MRLGRDIIILATVASVGFVIVKAAESQILFNQTVGAGQQLTINVSRGPNGKATSSPSFSASRAIALPRETPFMEVKSPPSFNPGVSFNPPTPTASPTVNAPITFGLSHIPAFMPAAVIATPGGPTPNVQPSTGMTLQQQLTNIGANHTAYLACGYYHLATDGNPGTPLTTHLSPPAGQTVLGCNAGGHCPTPGAVLPAAPPCAVISGSITVSTWTQTTCNGATCWYSNALAGKYAQPNQSGSGGKCGDALSNGSCKWPQDFYLTPNAQVSGGVPMDPRDSVEVTRTSDKTLATIDGVTNTSGGVGGCKWFFDYTNQNGHGNDVIFTTCDPTNSLAELQVAAPIYLSNGSITFQNLTVDKLACGFQNDCLDTNGGNNDVEAENWVIHNNGEGLGAHKGSQGTQILYNEVRENGMSGINTSGTSATVAKGNYIRRNNTDAVNLGFEAGGSKFNADNGDNIADNTWDSNNGIGLWCDSDCKKVTFAGNLSVNNLGPGISYEIGDDGDIVNNTLQYNAQFWPSQCVANHVPVFWLYPGGTATPFDPCTGAQRANPNQIAATGGACNNANGGVGLAAVELWVHESWCMTVGRNFTNSSGTGAAGCGGGCTTAPTGGSGFGNTISSVCGGIREWSDGRDLMCDDDIEYNTTNVCIGSGTLPAAIGGDTSSTGNTFNNGNSWNNNIYQYKNTTVQGNKNFQWGSGAGCHTATNTTMTFGTWTGTCGNDTVNTSGTSPNC